MIIYNLHQGPLPLLKLNKTPMSLDENCINIKHMYIKRRSTDGSGNDKYIKMCPNVVVVLIYSPTTVCNEKCVNVFMHHNFTNKKSL